ncbi:MAG TPA: pyridoxamine 5'-phosphate oxidase family protein [Candidatus Mediterraneibacter norfolkensis]|nr:pyridoxamine 5'-phosphate oxidase family protein [Candidatus Mediterraneibacter norfolkensis]
MRPMRLFKREIKDEEILREILEECDVVRLGCCDGEGMFIVPVNYGYEFEPDGEQKKLKLYIHGAKEGRKAEAFAKDPSVAVEMDCRHEVITGDYTCSYSYAYRSIMGNGMIHLLTEKEEQIHALTKIMEHMAPEAEIDFRPEMLERTAVFCIDVEDFTGKERKKK